MRPINPIRPISAFVCTLLLTFLLTSCQPGSSGTNSAGGGTKHKLAFVTNNASDFWTIARKGTEKAAKDIPSIEVEFRIPSDGTAAEQQRVIDELLAKGHQGLKEALAGSNVSIIDVRTDNTDLVRAKANAADSLVNYPDLAGMVGLWA